PPPSEKVALVVDTGGHTADVTALAFTPDGRELMSAARDGTVRFWDWETGETTQVLRPPLPGIAAAALSPDGQRVAVAGPAGKDWLTLLLSRQDDRVRTFHDQPVHQLAFSPDGKWLASVGGNLRLWDVERGGEPVTPKDGEGASHAVAFAPGGK